ncbi:hypothetical protein TrLO_g12961 [Triparma laevis f. longispina]|uniref:Uncharacterized protein n=1 Tax=Triparma laevis f. longispina TaxID=1714387 RepID=A0A9W7KY83_9STRA|nr:hypothetical protein TrLO_g12961 [Triparma laevis f. longispina]
MYSSQTPSKPAAAGGGGRRFTRPERPAEPKPIAGFDVENWFSTFGKRGFWPTSLKNLMQLAKNDGFNEYFRNQFNGNEQAYLRWREPFDKLKIVLREEGGGVSLEQ